MIQLLRPGTSLPPWVRVLDEGAFGEAWGDLAAQEHVWTLDGAAFARWSVLRLAEEAELLRIAVEPAARQRGLGLRLLRGCEAELGALGIKALHLEVRHSNAAAQALYEAAGWRPAGMRRAYYRDGEDAALYTKALG